MDQKVKAGIESERTRAIASGTWGIFWGEIKAARSPAASELSLQVQFRLVRRLKRIDTSTGGRTDVLYYIFALHICNK